jgi:sugar lactone lactonase YvrE
MKSETAIGHRDALHCTVSVLLLSFAVSTRSVAAPTTPPTATAPIEYEIRVAAQHLAGPAGLALHPATREVYVAERDANRIVVLRNGVAVPVISSGWQMADELPAWMVKPQRGRAAWLDPQLNRPQAVAFSRNGNLFVTEDLPSGRVLEFTPNADGSYSAGRVVTVPWMDKDYTWTGITISDDGRIFLAGAADRAGPGLHFGTIIMRDPDGDWWVVDYGPFTRFSSVCLNRDEDVLVTGDETTGAVTWWDGVRHRVIGTVSPSLPDAHGLCLLPDGSFLLTQPAAAGAADAGGRLVRINPHSQQISILANTPGNPRSVICDTRSGTLYVSEPESGTIRELSPRTPPPRHEYLLRRSLYSFEMSQGLSPKKWPEFIKDFVQKLGVQPTDQPENEDGRDKPEEPSTTFTIREFADRIPMIAGRVKVVSAEVQTSSIDPVSQIDFVVFYPGRTVINGPNATPSLGLFSATHHSGKKERTRVVDGYRSSSYTPGGAWKKHSNQAFLYFPMTSCTTERKPEGVDVNLAFLGMGFSEDYYLRLNCGNVDKGQLIIDGRNGQLSTHDVNFTEYTHEGEEVRNILIAGFDPQNQEDLGWLKIGKTPVGNRLNIEDHIRWFSHRMAQFRSLFENRELDMRLVKWREEDGVHPLEAGIPSPTADRNEPARPGDGFEDQAQDFSSPRADRAPERTPAGDQATAPGAEPAEKEVSRSTEDIEPAPSWTNLILSRAIAAWQQD